MPMPDDPKKRGPADRSRINVNERYEVSYWTKALGVSADRLKTLVKRVGPMVKDVKKALRM